LPLIVAHIGIDCVPAASVIAVARIARTHLLTVATVPAFRSSAEERTG
jgi:hypothetical protein